MFVLAETFVGVCSQCVFLESIFDGLLALFGVGKGVVATFVVTGKYF